MSCEFGRMGRWSAQCCVGDRAGEGGGWVIDPLGIGWTRRGGVVIFSDTISMHRSVPRWDKDVLGMRERIREKVHSALPGSTRSGPIVKTLF